MSRFTTRLRIDLSNPENSDLLKMGLKAKTITYQLVISTPDGKTLIIPNPDMPENTFRKDGYAPVGYSVNAKYASWAEAKENGLSAHWTIYMDGAELWNRKVKQMFLDNDKTSISTAQIVKLSGAVTQKSGVHPNQAKQALRSPDGACCATLPPAIKPTKGSSNYYRLRHNDFIKRHKACDPGKQPPAYYLQYGEKYAARFLMVTRQYLSPEGQAWMDQVLINLQSILDEGVTTLKLTDERKIIRPNNKDFKVDLTKTREAIMKYMEKEGYPKPYKLKDFLQGIECRSDHHFMFAFMSHPDAYMPKWLGSLPCKDLLHIGFTPDLSEWHPFGKHNKTTTDGAKATWSQAWQVAQRVDEDYWSFMPHDVYAIFNGIKIAGKCAVELPVDVARHVLETVVGIENLNEVTTVVLDGVDAAVDAAKKILP